MVAYERGLRVTSSLIIDRVPLLAITLIATGVLLLQAQGG